MLLQILSPGRANGNFAAMLVPVKAPWLDGDLVLSRASYLLTVHNLSEANITYSHSTCTQN